MTGAIPLVQIWRGDFLESQHQGHAVIVDDNGHIVRAWGDPNIIILPRSSCKILQAIPLVASGAADAAGLDSTHLALACASHQGAAIHTDKVQAWLAHLGYTNDDFRCGPQMPKDQKAQTDLIKSDQSPCRYHNNCSGKHTGFLTLTKHLRAGSEYHQADHPVQRAVHEAFEELTRCSSPGFAIDGCSAPNFATTLVGLARAMAFCAVAQEGRTAASNAAARLRDAMIKHPELVAGTGRACTELMQACPNVALKTGAEAVFTAILPERKLGVAVKIEDGAFRASEAVITAILCNLGVLDAAHPAALRRLGGSLQNWDGLKVGQTRMVKSFWQNG